MNGTNLKRKLNRVSLKPMRMLISKNGFNQKEVARKMELSLPTLRRYISDPRRMNDYQVVKLARVIRVDVFVIRDIINNHKTRKVA